MNGSLRRSWRVLAVTLVAAIAALSVLSREAAIEPAEFVEWQDVCFPHAMHFNDLEIECEACHHETNAATLSTPHEQYFEDFWIECTTCHKPEASAATPTACSTCHHDSPSDIADETLSSKAVIHRSCWQCHEAGTGVEASRSCATCHSGEHLHSVSDSSDPSAGSP